MFWSFSGNTSANRSRPSNNGSHGTAVGGRRGGEPTFENALEVVVVIESRGEGDLFDAKKIIEDGPGGDFPGSAIAPMEGRNELDTPAGDDLAHGGEPVGDHPAGKSPGMLVEFHFLYRTVQMCL